MKEKFPEKQTPLSSLGEFGLIDRMVALAPEGHFFGLVGPGDDCAVIPSTGLCPGGGKFWQVVTTDSLVEGRHFRLDYSSFFEVGWKSLAVSLSDVAAMGGEPRLAVIALQARPDLSIENLEELYRGIYQVASEYNVTVAGGDTVSADRFAITFSVIGVTEKPPLLRSGAGVGESIWVTGEIGGAGAALDVLDGRLSPEVFGRLLPDVLNRHRQPVPRVELGKLLLERGLARSMIDISDGLLQDSRHISRRSSVRLIISLSQMPYQQGLIEANYSRERALSSGDDYELLFTALPEMDEELARLSCMLVNGKSLPRLTKIGTTAELSPGKSAEVVIETPNGNALSAEELLGGGSLGYQHF